RIASTMFWPCETRTSTCRSFATISSGLYRFLAIAVLLDVKDIPQVGPLQWGWITAGSAHRHRGCVRYRSAVDHHDRFQLHRLLRWCIRCSQTGRFDTEEK